MPRPNKERTLGSERTLAQRVAFERDARGWTYENLAQRMTSIGCSIQASALFKIEKGDPPRRVTVDELVALANVFEVKLDELLIPVALVRDRRARSLVKKWAAARDQLGEVQDALDLWHAALVEHMRDHPESRAAIEAELSAYARASQYPDADEAARYWSDKLRKDSKHLPRKVD